MEKGYNPYSYLLSIGVWTSLSASICYFFIIYLKKHKDETLNSLHAFKLALFWVGLKLLLIPVNCIDLFFHHQWKLIVYNLPYDQAYDDRCFGFDYPPLFMVFEAFWANILGFLSPSDMRF